MNLNLPRQEVVAGIIWNQERFLCSCRQRGKYKGLWEFPGGKIETGETQLEALVRELREELDIVVEKAKLWRTVEHFYPDTLICLNVFHVTKFSGKPKALEGQPLAWLTAIEASQHDFLAADIPLIAALCNEGLAPTFG